MENINFKKEITTVWSFPDRGKWNTQRKLSRQFCTTDTQKSYIEIFSRGRCSARSNGGRTTLIETKLLNRQGIGFDINPQAVEIAKKNLEFEGDYKYNPIVKVGDIRNLREISDESIDLIVTHPPYLNIIEYSKGIDGDLSNISGVKKFCGELEKGIIELRRVLKENKYCGILIGDTRKSSHYVPLAFYVMDLFLKNGFILKEDIIKVQHNCKSTPYWERQVENITFI